MILPDVNVLIYAFRQDVPHHALCHSWLAGVANGDARFGLSPLALSALVRVTVPVLDREPDSLQAAERRAVTFVEAIFPVLQQHLPE